MRGQFAQDGVVLLDEPGDERAPGAAITVALCGSWQHEPPCPVAPHHTAGQREGRTLRLHVVFAAEPGLEGEVRARIEAALAAGGLTGPDGALTTWRMLSCGPGRLLGGDRHLAERLAAGQSPPS